MVEPLPLVRNLRLRSVVSSGGIRDGSLWGFVLPSRGVRVLLVGFPLIAAITEAWSIVAGGRPDAAAVIAASVAMNVSIMAMAWRPPVAAVALLATGALAVAVGREGEYLTVLAMSIGVIFYTCTSVFAVAYAVASVAWIVSTAVIPPGLAVEGLSALFVIGLISAAVGRGLRLAVMRNLALRSDLAAHETRFDEALRVERERIADELHDVIAHDISIAVMHARVLERTDDPQTRATSQRAVVEASVQALTDTRRVLHLIYGRAGSEPVVGTETADFRSEVDELAQKLRDLGDEVELRVCGEGEPAGIIGLTLSRAAREAVTNIVKHAASPRRVRIAVALSPETAVLEVVDEPVRGGGGRGVDGRGVGGSAVGGAAVGGDRSSEPGAALGLVRLRERVEVLGGEFSAGPDAGAWRVRISLPTR